MYGGQSVSNFGGGKHLTARWADLIKPPEPERTAEEIVADMERAGCLTIKH
jgi:hypothetical protein